MMPFFLLIYRETVIIDIAVSEKYKIVISCAAGLSSLLAGEIRSLRLPVVSETLSGVSTEGTFEDALRLNLHVRTGHRVLFYLNDFRAECPDDLYRGITMIPWEDYIPADGYLCVSSSVSHETIRDSRYANMRCKDAIVDRIRSRRGRRPDSGPEKEGASVFFYWKRDRCFVYLDTSGDPLARRGYRKIPLKAPLQETLAAAIVMTTGWCGGSHFINPMCGSGTLAIEAALIGLNKAAGLLRDNYAFMHLNGFDRALWDLMKETARRQSRNEVGGRIVATDTNPEAIAAAKKNAENAGVADFIEFKTCDFAETVVPDGDGVVVLNPEYGERMGAGKDLPAHYRRIGDFLKQRCRGYRGYVFTGNPALAKMVGLRTRRRVRFFNGKIECRLLEYELYEGSRKTGRGIDNVGEK